MNPGRLMVGCAILAMAACAFFGFRTGALQLPFGHDPNVHDAPAPTATVYGPVYLEPDVYQHDVFKDRWLKTMPLRGSTFGTLLLQQVRFELDGRGAMTSRAIRAETPAAVRLLQGPRERRTLTFIHGLQQLLDDREAYLLGLSMSTSEPGYTANAIYIYVHDGLFDEFAHSRADQRKLIDLILKYADASQDTYAWFQFDAHSIVLGPIISKEIVGALNDPASVPAKDQLQAAFVLRHELEHSVSAYDSRFDAPQKDRRLRWLEEGGTDTIARWPGVAVDTAKRLGLRVPPAAKGIAYDRFNTRASGYNPWVHCVRTLLMLGGIDLSDPTAIDAVLDLLQGATLDREPARLVDLVATHRHLSAKQRTELARRVAALDGDPRRADAIARWLHATPLHG